MIAILAFCVPLLMADPAAAHVCALPVQVPVDEPASITVGVGAEASAITEINVAVPEGFRLTDASGEGWQTDVQDDAVRFSGGSIDPFTCSNVTLRGVAEEQDKLAFPLELRTAEDDVVVYDTLEPFYEDSAQLVYAGLELPGLPPSDDGGVDVLRVAGWVLMGSALLAGIVWALSRWRSRQPEPAAHEG